MTRTPLAMLAHEIRSPVAALAAIAAAYPVADEAARARLRELAATAGASIERLLADPALTSFHRQRLDAGRLAEAAAEAAALGGASVVATAEQGLTVDGDPARLRQALDNLITNAVGHSPDGATVAVTAYRTGASVAIAVTDEGEGIAREDLARVFEVGVRLTSARPGAGLGLAVVRSIAHAHGGNVEVESSPGRGATFRLVLPGASAVG